MLAAMRRGTLVKLAGDDKGSDADTGGEARASGGNGDAVVYQGFNLHAAVAIRQGDEVGRERLFRYGLRIVGGIPGAIELSRASYQKMIRNLGWATGNNVGNVNRFEQAPFSP